MFGYTHFRSLARSWWCHLTILVLLSMALFAMYERFQTLGYGHLHAFVDGEVWRVS